MLHLLAISLLLHIYHLDGRLLFVTPMDPLFLILYYLIKADKEVSLLYFSLNFSEENFVPAFIFSTSYVDFRKRSFQNNGNLVCT